MFRVSDGSYPYIDPGDRALNYPVSFGIPCRFLWGDKKSLVDVSTSNPYMTVTLVR